jgi:hypothetical protein
MLKTYRFALIILFILSGTAAAQTTSFTYQGRLTTSGTPATGNYDFEFRLFDALTNGTQQGTTQTLTNVAVDKGVFSVGLDFGACPTCFNGAARFLDISVRQAGGGAFTPLAPRQPLTSTPYAIKSLNAATADGLSVACVNCVTSGQIASVNGSAVTGTIPLASLPDLGATYIKNATAQQGASNFNISGTGTADILNAVTQFNLGGNRILSNAGSDNLFAGQRAGELNTGTFNAFFGRDAGRFNTSGSNNTFVGGDAGFNNDQGASNVYVGSSAGFNAFGSLANGNTFVGASAGAGNTSGRGNTMVGFQADVPLAGGVINATAIGQRALVTQSNALVLGAINGVNGATADTNVGIGTTAPTQRLHVVGDGLFTGTLNAGLINATTQYNIGSLRAFYINDSTATNTNTVVGVLAGSQNPTGKFNSFFGCGAGQSTTTGGNNSFFGCGAGGQNQTGSDNAFFGKNAGQLTTNSDNSFFGSSAGAANTNGFGNVFFGKEAGRNNTTGFYNSFIGNQAGFSNTTGTQNSFFGSQAGNANTTGDANAFFGFEAGLKNTDGRLNAFFGAQAGVFNTTGLQNSFFGAQAGTATTSGTDNVFFGTSAGTSNTTGIGNAFFGSQAGNASITGNANTFIGVGANFATVNPTGDNNTLLGALVRVNSGISNGTAIGTKALVTQSNSLILGSINGVNGATADTSIGIGTTAPTFKLQVIDPSNTGLRVQTIAGGGTVASFGGVGDFSIDANGVAGGRFVLKENGNVGIGNPSPTDKLVVTGGFVRLLLAGAGSTNVCWNGSNQLSFCSSSRRYKSNIIALHSGLSLINRLHPVTFDWKQSGEHDLGLVAEEVARVEPLLVTHNDRGEIEGVKYDRVAVVLLNAVKEQQAQIQAQRRLIEEQQQQLKRQEARFAALEKLVCASQRKSRVCR